MNLSFQFVGKRSPSPQLEDATGRGDTAPKWGTGSINFGD